ncbi:MAG: hypothetical protein Q4B59_05465 [Lachnospiraceae bacterium]|nr:hypothetical protein [Lachnospiraceae bacterium]
MISKIFRETGRRVLGLGIVLSLMGVLCPCASEVEPEQAELYAGVPEEKMSRESENSGQLAEGWETLVGAWKVGAIDYDFNDNPDRNMILDIGDADALSDLYDGIYLSFSANGTFCYTDLFSHEGTYKAHPQKPGTYILKTDRSYRMTIEDGEVVKVESDSKPSYILEECEDALHFQEYDPFTGKAKANDNGYYFVRVSEESSFVQENKTELELKKTEADKTEAKEEVYNASYADILETYTRKMEEAVPVLVSEYESAAAGVSDIETLAEICVEKVEELAEISNEGVGEMADLMYENGDSYDVYSGWAEKLMNKYIEISQEIQNAYLESAW